MFGAMKRAMVVAAVAAAGVTAPSVASADRWYVGGSVLTGMATAQVEGESTLSFSVQILPGLIVTTSCDVSTTADVWNQGVPSTGHGQVTVFDPTEVTCTVTGLPNCRVSSVTAVTPWTIEVLAGTRVRISNVDFTPTYAGVPPQTCALAGNRQITGSVTGTWSNATNELQFVNEGGLIMQGVVPVITNGNAYLEEEGTGAAVTLGT